VIVTFRLINAPEQLFQALSCVPFTIGRFQSIITSKLFSIIWMTRLHSNV
jgi:hypothetical protein